MSATAGPASTVRITLKKEMGPDFLVRVTPTPKGGEAGGAVLLWPFAVATSDELPGCEMDPGADGLARWRANPSNAAPSNAAPYNTNPHNANPSWTLSTVSKTGSGLPRQRTTTASLTYDYRKAAECLPTLLTPFLSPRRGCFYTGDRGADKKCRHYNFPPGMSIDEQGPNIIAAGCRPCLEAEKLYTTISATPRWLSWAARSSCTNGENSVSLTSEWRRPSARGPVLRWEAVLINQYRQMFTKNHIHR